MRRFLALCAGILILGSPDVEQAFAQKKKKDTVVVPKLSEVPKLMEQLKDKDSRVRAHAAAQLAARGQVRARDVKDAIGPLVQMVKSDEDPAARRAAALALSQIDPDPQMVVTPLIAALKDDKDLDVKAACATALGALGPAAKEAVPALHEVDGMLGAAKKKGGTKEDRAKAALKKTINGALRQITGGKKK